MTYDYLDRVTGISGATVPARTFSYNLLGMQTGATLTSGGQSVANAFDAFGRVTSQTTPQGAVSYQYDAASRRTRITWPDTFFVTYVYDVAGNVTAIRESGATSGLQVLASYGYDDLGRRTSVTYGNGATRSYSYDAVNRLAGLKIDPTGTANDLIIGAVGGTGTAIGYSPASQITSLTKSNDAYAWTDHYNFDRNYTTNGLNQYTASGSTSLGYDGRGNLTSSGGTTYTYNGLNQLTSVSGGNSATLTYDPADRLYQLVSGSVTTRYLYDGVNLIGEYNGSNALLRRFVPGPGTDEPIVWYEGSGTTSRRWLQGDERGSIVTVLDASGAAIGLNRFDEYGIPQSTNTGRFQYTGQVWLGEAGLYYYKARFYSPTLGRFMQTDPIGYRDGMNWHNYVKADPINSVDPSGLLGRVCIDGPEGYFCGPPEPGPSWWDFTPIDIVPREPSDGGGGGNGDPGEATGPDITVRTNRPGKKKSIASEVLCSVISFVPGNRIRFGADAAAGLGGVIGVGTGISLEDSGRVSWDIGGMFGPGIGAIAGAGFTFDSNSTAEGVSGQPGWMLQGAYGLVGGSYSNSAGSENGGASLSIGPKAGLIGGYVTNPSYGKTLLNLDCGK